MSEDNKINQGSCSNEQLFQITDTFLENMMMSAVEFRDCFEKLRKHIVDLCGIMDNLEAKKLSSTNKSNVIPISLFLSDKLDLNKGKTTDDV